MDKQEQKNGPLNILLSATPEPWLEGLLSQLKPTRMGLYLAETARQAIDIGNRVPVHLAVLDDNLPKLGGLQVIRVLRRQGRQFPSILLTKCPNRYILERALRLHVYSVVRKPVEMTVIGTAVRQVMWKWYGQEISVPQETQ